MTITETIASGEAKNASDIAKEMLQAAKLMRAEAKELERIAAILGKKKLGRPHSA